MSSFKILGLAAVAAVLAVPALALAQAAPLTDQPAPAASQPAGAMNPSPPDTAMAPSAGANGANASGVLTYPMTTHEGGATITNTLVTNGPVPDTAANRAKYGAPMSNTGKKTAPAGN